MNIEQYLENGIFTDNSLANLQRELHDINGRGFDVYHCEIYRGVIVTEKDAGLSISTSSVRISY